MFTYNYYKSILEKLVDEGYSFENYAFNHSKKKVVILRHDIDFSLEKALEMAKFENNYTDIKSTFFILLSSNFYNVFSKKNQTIINEIANLGHDIGLHFDENKYNFLNVEELVKFINYELSILRQLFDFPIRFVSLHRPTSKSINYNFQSNNFINSYGHEFFNDFKYVSDSRMLWHDNIFKIIKKQVNKIHLLTHPIWYQKNQTDFYDVLRQFIKSKNTDIKKNMAENIRNLDIGEIDE